MKKSKVTFWVFLAATFAALFITCTGALAAGGPQPWEMGMQDAASPTAERIHAFHNLLLWVITAITVFVLLLMLIIVVRFNSKANPVPSKTTHNTMLEVIWTVIPVIILVVIAVPSLKLLYYADRTADPEMTLKVTGYQWYWGYDYPDNDDISFMANRIPDDEINPDQVRLLSTDNPVVLPVETNIRILVTAGAEDVLHSFAVPAFGVKVDAVPGRMNETWVRITKPGTYYGQCSELCGQGHAFMPIEVKAVSKTEFERWVKNGGSFFAAGAQKDNVNFAKVEETE